MSLKTGSRWSNWAWDKPVKAFVWRSSRICRPIGGLPPWFFEDSLPHLLLRNNSIAWGRGTSQVGGQRAHDNCVDTTTVEDVILDNDMRMAVSGFRTRGFVQFNPKDIALLNYHSPSTICRCCRRMRRRRACSSEVGASV